MKLMIATANEYEMAGILKYLNEQFQKISFFEFKLNQLSVFPVVFGPGILQTSFGISRYKKIEEIDLLIYGGIAGAFHTELDLGKVVNVTSERIIDQGLISAAKPFQDFFDLEIMNPNKFPFSEGLIQNEDENDPLNLTQIHGATSNTFVLDEDKIQSFHQKHPFDILSLEGAAVHYACKMLDLNFIQIRAISQNLRKPYHANLELALVALNDTFKNYLNHFSSRA